MKKIDYIDGKFVSITDAEIVEHIEEVELDIDTTDYTEKTVKHLAYPKELETCVSVNKEFHIRVDCNGWLKLTKEQSAKLCYELANFVES